MRRDGRPDRSPVGRRAGAPGRIGGVRASAAVLVLVLAAGCDRTDPSDRTEFEPVVAFDSAAVAIETDADTFHLRVEVAETRDQRAYGLMERPSLPADHGMLFVYAEPQDAGSGFWMYRTRIPLDIAFMDEDGRIVAVRAMAPCESPYARSCPTYSPGVPYSSALEVNRGYFERRGIGIGDRVVVVRDADGGADAVPGHAG